MYVRLRRLGLGVAGIVLFLVAVRVLGTAVDWMAPAAGEILPRLVAHPASALGAGWTLTYLLLNGSVVAAFAVTLAAGGVMDAASTFLVVAGSRLGAASFVVLVGFLDYRRRAGRQTLRGALELGLLTFVVTHTIYLPALGVGLLGIRELSGPLGQLAGAGHRIPVPTLEFLTPGLESLLRLGGAIPVFLAAILLLIGAVRIADHALRSVDRERLRTRYLSHLTNRWISFAAGLLLTLVTASIAFSVGILVPLFNRGHISRNEIIPYLLGANLGTLADTYLVTLVLRTEAGGTAVLALVLGAAVITAVSLAGFRWYSVLVDQLVATVTATRLAFTLFGATLVTVPTLLWLVPLL